MILTVDVDIEMKLNEDIY